MYLKLIAAVSRIRLLPYQCLRSVFGQVPRGILPEFLRVDGDDVRQRRAPVLVQWFSLVADNRQDTPPVRVRTLLLWSLTGNALCFGNTVWGAVRRQNAQGAP